jgi:tRNA G18 (ribose-2'-O)-methylase SpoU
VEQTSASISLEKYHFKNDKIVLIFGNEIEGVSQKLINECDLSLEIPQYGTKHSMNISVTTGMVLWTIKMNKLLKQHEM